MTTKDTQLYILGTLINGCLLLSVFHWQFSSVPLEAGLYAEFAVASLVLAIGEVAIWRRLQAWLTRDAGHE